MRPLAARTTLAYKGLQYEPLTWIWVESYLNGNGDYGIQVRLRLIRSDSWINVLIIGAQEALTCTCH